jgi:acyl carrier protein
MSRQDGLRLLEEALGVTPHTLSGGEKLRDLELWDSLSTMTFIGLVDKKFGLPLQGSRVARCQTVEELISLLGPDASHRAA